MDESRAKLERDLIQVLKMKHFEGQVQHYTWNTGALRTMREAVKRKGSASTAAATSSAPATAAAANKKRGRPQPPNMDGSIASISVKPKKKCSKNAK